MKKIMFAAAILTVMAVFSAKPSNAGAIGDMMVNAAVADAVTNVQDNYREGFVEATRNYIAFTSEISKGLLGSIERKNPTHAEIGLFIGVIQQASRTSLAFAQLSKNASLLETTKAMFETANKMIGFCVAEPEGIAKGDIEALIKKLNRMVKLSSQT